MTTAEAFYAQRDLRTSEYLAQRDLSARAVHLEIDAVAARARSGQLALLALINLVARVHRRVSIHIGEPAVPTLVSTPFPGATLAESVLQTARAIDPYGAFELGAHGGTDAITCGVGTASPGLDYYIGWDGCVGTLDRRALLFAPDDSALLGAAVAACLGATALFRAAHDMATPNRILSAWNYLEGAGAERGPSTLTPLDVGRVLVIGAGAVAAALAYWCHSLGVTGAWTIVDQDTVALHNTNRGMVFTPAQSGWPNGAALFKADVLAAAIPHATSLISWYDTCEALREKEFDVLLCLANERSVRQLVAARSAPVVLQATTGTTWLSQLHRHVGGLDDCPSCRLVEVMPLQLACSTVPMPTAAGSADAALPFLSAASGLMLYTALKQVETGELAARSRNDWRWDFDSPHRMASSGARRCHAECSTTMAPHLRRALYGATRWAHLDTAALT